MGKKIRHLPITDLARIAVMDSELRFPALQQVNTGGGGPSYRPTRQKLADVVDRKPGMFESERAPWSVVEEDLKKLSYSDREEKMNLLAGKSIYNYCAKNDVHARELEGYPLSFNVGLKLVCWSPALFVYPDRISVPFFDMRRKYFLTPGATKFMFSVMNIALRENNPDYSEVEFEVLRLSDSKDRAIRPISEGDMSLYSYEELEQMISETQSLWIKVQEGRIDQRRDSDPDWDIDSLFG
ncbi:hypothetical protein [Sphingorhabdus sp. YGSMI21]|uniref:hypothetical protein n=1 Tax=Sphingorhabdus sp. YGSMI21 TaxID=2077182 RepID=UPI000F5164CE|nr:hypothetical protein [Sphingorhabdus sp. YGSMI21]